MGDQFDLVKPSLETKILYNNETDSHLRPYCLNYVSVLFYNEFNLYCGHHIGLCEIPGVIEVRIREEGEGGDTIILRARSKLAVGYPIGKGVNHNL